MALSLYDASVATYLQILPAICTVLDKGKEHCETTGTDLQFLVDARLYEDMLPLGFQLASVIHHSVGSIEGVKKGVFGPPTTDYNVDFARLRNMLGDALNTLEAYTPEEINSLQGKAMEFRMDDFHLPFDAEGFLLSFSLPNFYFHATTAYDILRNQGVPLSKIDYLGTMRLRSE